jgi:hypothetical protein
MITFLFIGLFGTGVFFAGLPIVCFALMLETCERRKVELTAKSPRVSSIRLLAGMRAVPSMGWRVRFPEAGSAPAAYRTTTSRLPTTIDGGLS